MAKDKSSKDKKDKSTSSSSGVSKKEHKKDKKEKKDKLVKALTDPVTGDVSDKLLKEIEKQQAEVDGKDEKKVKKEKKQKKEKGKDTEGDVEMDRADIIVPIVKVKEAEDEDESVPKKVAVKVAEGGDILVPFATPLANEKVTKKALKAIKKGSKCKVLKRGVKEVVKSIRKSPTSSLSSPHGIVILAADISPMDVISHIPVLCEDHNIPYVFVQSRAELGLAGGTKRPTSVIMIVPSLARSKKSKDGKEKESKKEDEEGLKESYDELAKAVKALQ